jgi:hypothetical protein
MKKSNTFFKYFLLAACFFAGQILCVDGSNDSKAVLLPASSQSMATQAVKVNPLDLLTASRFDIVAKYIYAKYLEFDVQCDWAAEMYKAVVKGSLAYQNDLVGAGGGNGGNTGIRDGDSCSGGKKIDDTKFEEIKNRFHKIIDAVKNTAADTFDHVVAFDSESKWIDGDVVAACMDVFVVADELGEGTITSALLKKYMVNDENNSRQWDLDAIALKLCELKSDVYTAIIFSCANAEGKMDLVRKIFEEYGEIVHEKDVVLFDNGPRNFVRISRLEDTWGHDDSILSGMEHKYFYNKKSEDNHYLMRLVVFKSQSIEKVKECKIEIRKNVFNDILMGSWWDWGYSMHINDRHSEAIRIAQSLLNEDSVLCLNTFQDNQFDDLLAQINKSGVEAGSRYQQGQRIFLSRGTLG